MVPDELFFRKTLFPARAYQETHEYIFVITRYSEDATVVIEVDILSSQWRKRQLPSARKFVGFKSGKENGIPSRHPASDK